MKIYFRNVKNLSRFRCFFISSSLQDIQWIKDPFQQILCSRLNFTRGRVLKTRIFLKFVVSSTTLRTSTHRYSSLPTHYPSLSSLLLFQCPLIYLFRSQSPFNLHSIILLTSFTNASILYLLYLNLYWGFSYNTF